MNKNPYGDPRPIQSPEGQQYIRRKHERCMNAISAYPTICRYVHNDQWAESFLAEMLAKDCDTVELGYPELYALADAQRLYRRLTGYMAKAEAGLAFLIERAPKRNRNDLIGNLQKSYSMAATFEVHLANALISVFGKDQVQPYPTIAPGSKKSVEFAVNANGMRVYFEATVLSDDQDEAASKTFCIRERVPFPFRFMADDEGVCRLVLKCQEKAMQRELDGPLVLCIKQFSSTPSPEVAMHAIDELAKWADAKVGCPMVAVGYWHSYEFWGIAWTQQNASQRGVTTVMADLVQQAMKQL